MLFSRVFPRGSCAGLSRVCRGVSCVAFRRFQNHSSEGFRASSSVISKGRVAISTHCQFVFELRTLVWRFKCPICQSILSDGRHCWPGFVLSVTPKAMVTSGLCTPLCQKRQLAGGASVGYRYWRSDEQVAPTSRLLREALKHTSCWRPLCECSVGQWK
eukprot:6992391-Prymnesium_polylepis.1